MPRSLYKGPFIDTHLMKKVETAAAAGERRPITKMVLDRGALLGREADGALFLVRARREERDEDDQCRGGDHERG